MEVTSVMFLAVLFLFGVAALIVSVWEFAWEYAKKNPRLTTIVIITIVAVTTVFLVSTRDSLDATASPWADAEVVPMEALPYDNCESAQQANSCPLAIEEVSYQPTEHEDGGIAASATFQVRNTTNNRGFVLDEAEVLVYWDGGWQPNRVTLDESCSGQPEWGSYGPTGPGRVPLPPGATVSCSVIGESLNQAKIDRAEHIAVVVHASYLRSSRALWRVRSLPGSLSVSTGLDPN